MGTPPQRRLPQSSQAWQTIGSSPLKEFNFYQDEDEDQGQDQDQDQEQEQDQSFEFKEEDELNMFKSPLEKSSSGQSFSFDPQTQLDSDAGLVVPVSRNEMAYNSNNEMLQYPPKYDMRSTRLGLMDQASSSSQYYTNQPYDPYPNMHIQQQQIQQQSQYQQSLYPAMMISPALVDQDIPVGSSSSNMPRPYPTNTMSSMNSIPAFLSTGTSSQSLMTPSQSDNSWATATMPFQNPSTTPRRPAQRRQSINNSTNIVTPGSQQIQHTPNQSLKRTPSTRIVKSHRRTRSRLSVDATGISLLTLQPSTSSTNARSPNATGGTNPFYTPTVYASPRHGSPTLTPLATPLVKKKDQSYASISPMMLMNEQGQRSATQTPQQEKLPADVFAEAADMTLKMASHFAYSTVPEQIPEQQQRSNSQQSQYQQHQQQRFQHRHSASMSGLSYSPFPTANSFLIDPTNSELTEATQNYTEDSSTSYSTSSTPLLTKRQPPESASSSLRPNPESNVTKSQSSLSLSTFAETNAKLIPPEITKYDILTPRKHARLKKSQSTNDVPTIPEIQLTPSTRRPKKVHACPLCNAIFQRPEHVKRHMRSHSSEKPFVCEEPDCGKRFNRGDNMKAHLRKFHGRTDV